METFDKIIDNFNGTITLLGETYFFDVNNNILKIFFNTNGITTVADFYKKYFQKAKKIWIYGICEDKNRVAFVINNLNYSSYPDKYIEFKLLACIKEKFYLLDTYNEKLNDFNKFCQIKISGELINNSCIIPFYKLDNNFNLKLNDEQLNSQEFCYIKAKKIKLNKSLRCLFEVSSIVNNNFVNKLSYDSNISFIFNKEKDLEAIIPIYFSIKSFIDIICLARNTKFNIELVQKYKEKTINFASVKIYEDYRNYCNRPINEYVQIPSISSNIAQIFDNLF